MIPGEKENPGGSDDSGGKSKKKGKGSLCGLPFLKKREKSN